MPGLGSGTHRNTCDHHCSALFQQGLSVTTGAVSWTPSQPPELPRASAAGKSELLAAQALMGSGMDTHGQGAYQVQDGCHDFVDSLNLLLLEANHLHGISNCLELSPIVDGTLRGERSLGWGI